MGTCYSSNKIETTNSSTKRPYDKSVKQTKSNSTVNCHHLVTPSYLATISSNQLIQINNQTHELKPKNSIVNETTIHVTRSTNQLTTMYESNKSKLISKLPKFNTRVHDSSQRNPTTITHFGGAKQTINADLLRLKNGLGKQTNKSSNSSLTNSETSCGSSSNSTASYHHSNNKLNQNRKTSTFTKATSSSTLNDRKVINKQPTFAKCRSSLNNHSSSNHRLNFETKQTDGCSSIQFSQALTKLPTTSKYTTTLTTIPKPQVAQRVLPRPTVLPNLNTNLDTLVQPSPLRPYSLKNSSNDNHQHKKPYTRTNASQEGKISRYGESSLKSLNTPHSSQNEDKSLQKSQISTKKLTSFSGLPVPSFRTSKTELRKSPPPPQTNRCSNEKLNEASKSLTLDDNLSSEKENKKLSTSFESSFLNNKTSPTAKELNERINQVKSFNKLLNHQFNNQNLQGLINKRQQTVNKSTNQQPNSVETTDDSNSINEQSCTNSQKSNSPNASLTPDLSNASKISPEHNNRSENQIYLDDEICDQPDLMFLNSKDNSTSTSPVKENVNLVDNLVNGQASYRTNIRYSISELDSLKLKQELLMSSSLKMNDSTAQSNKVDNLSSVSSSPEKSISSPVRPTSFRKPRPLSYVESENGSLALDNSSFRSVLQDLNGIKTLLFRLQGELQKSETQNPFENILNSSQTKDQNLMMENCDGEISEDKCGFMNDVRNENLEIENQNLKKQLALQQQKLDEKDRTIRLLQQQMTKYLNINEATNETKKTSNSATQTDRCTDFNKSRAPESRANENGIVVRSSFGDQKDLA